MNRATSNVRLGSVAKLATIDNASVAAAASAIMLASSIVSPVSSGLTFVSMGSPSSSSSPNGDVAGNLNSKGATDNVIFLDDRDIDAENGVVASWNTYDDDEDALPTMAAGPIAPTSSHANTRV
jgi:hypothetical protein